MPRELILKEFNQAIYPPFHLATLCDHMIIGIVKLKLCSPA